jgi:chromosome segregation ATPase
MDEEGPFIPGVIEEIQLKNFMTYQNCTIRPGKEFNVILGPNGSGKSSIVSAIVIGLGGDISTLRRQKHLGDLVNNHINDEDESQDAEITIRLFKTENTTYEFFCRISRENVITYKIDGKAKDKRDVSKLANSLQIQTENMCQFLPQDRVREFPEMKPEQIFQNSLKAVGNLKMLELNKEGETLENQRKQFEHTIETKSASITTNNRQYSLKKNLIDDMEKRKELEDRINVLEIFRLEIEANNCKAVCTSALVQNKSKSEDMKKAKTEQEKLTESMKDYHKGKQERTEEIGRNRKKLNELQIQLKSPKGEVVKEQINDLEKKYKNIKREMNESTSKKKDLETEITKLNDELRQIDGDKLEVDKNQFTDRLNTVEYEKEVLMSDLKHCNDEYETASKREQNSGGRLRKAQNDMKSDEIKRYKRLENRNADARKGVDWLKMNRTKFHEPKKIYEPIMTVIRLKEQYLEYAVQLENIIGSNELEAFVCENNEDANLLMRELRKTLYKINVVHSTSGGNQQFPRPDWDKRGLIRIKYIFLDEIIDTDSCPEAVMIHLKKKKRIHQIPIFEKETDLLATYCDRYFVGKRLFTFSNSRYSKEKLEKCDNLENSVSQYLNVSDDGSDEHTLQEIIKTWESNKRQADEVNRKKQTYQQKLEECKSNLDEIRKSLDGIRCETKRKEKLSWLFDEKKSLLKSISGGNLHAELKECTKTIKEEMNRLPQCQEEILSLIQVKIM